MTGPIQAQIRDFEEEDPQGYGSPLHLPPNLTPRQRCKQRATALQGEAPLTPTWKEKVHGSLPEGGTVGLNL